VNHSISRRRFVYYISLLAVIIQLPISACKRILHLGNYNLSDEELLTLNRILNLLLPENENSPGANSISALTHIKSVLTDNTIKSSQKQTIKNGIRWADDVSKRIFDKECRELQNMNIEEVLREMETFKKGKKFLSLLLTYTFEAMLGDPIYQINDDQKGWKWLHHIPGNPRPSLMNKYKPNE